MWILSKKGGEGGEDPTKNIFYEHKKSGQVASLEYDVCIIQCEEKKEKRKGNHKV